MHEKVIVIVLVREVFGTAVSVSRLINTRSMADGCVHACPFFRDPDMVCKSSKPRWSGVHGGVAGTQQHLGTPAFSFSNFPKAWYSTPGLGDRLTHPLAPVSSGLHPTLS